MRRPGLATRTPTSTDDSLNGLTHGRSTVDKPRSDSAGTDGMLLRIVSLLCRYSFVPATDKYAT